MTAQDIIDRFPNEDATTITDTFPLISGAIGCYYGGDFNNACDREPMLLLAMHLIKVEEMSSRANLREAASKAVDGVSVSYSIPQSDGSGFFSTTKYGRMYEQIISIRGIGAVFV